MWVIFLGSGMVFGIAALVLAWIGSRVILSIRRQQKKFEIEDETYNKVKEAMADGESIKIYNAKHVTSGGHLVFDSDGSTVAYLSSSAKRYKNHLSNMTLDEAEKILDIPVVWFNYKEGYLAEDDQMNGKPVPGMYAEDVAKYYPVGAYNNEEGLVENWNERMIIPAMLKLLQNLYKRIS